MTITTPKPKKHPAVKAALKKPVVAKRPVAHRSAAAKPITKTGPAPTSTHGSYVFTRAVGRRKEAVARVRLYPKGSGKITINERELTKYFPTFDQQLMVKQPLTITGTETAYDVGVKVLGGGTQGQAVAVRHGISRALVSINEDYRRALRAAGCLTRDSRVKERKKYGLKKARRAPQFSKR